MSRESLNAAPPKLAAALVNGFAEGRTIVSLAEEFGIAPALVRAVIIENRRKKRKALIDKQRKARQRKQDERRKADAVREARRMAILIERGIVVPPRLSKFSPGLPKIVATDAGLSGIVIDDRE